MTRLILLLSGILTLMPLWGQDVLVNTRSPLSETIASDGELSYDLREFFQLYPSPGPVATFRFSMPVTDERRDLFIERIWNQSAQRYDLKFEGLSENLMTYQLADEGSYSNVFEVFTADDFLWETVEVQFQLLAEDAPIAVGNFLTYVNEGAYDGTVIHRTITGATGENIISQAGAYAINPGAFLKVVPSRGNIVFEQTIRNETGTLAMASQGPFSSTASNQFYINLSDNRAIFGNAYTVFGRLIDMETALPPLLRQVSGRPYNVNRFNLPWETWPLYTPYFEVAANHARFDSISVPAGSSEGVTYSWEFPTVEDTEPTEDELANRAAFDITLTDGMLSIKALDTGRIEIRFNATAGDQTASVTTRIVAFEQAALNRFPVSQVFQGGWMNNVWFGWMLANDHWPWVLHGIHGWLYIAEDTAFDFVYAYDQELQSWLYFTETQYRAPGRVYHFGIQQWIWVYRPDQLEPGYSGEPRWFYVFPAAGEDGQWLSPSELRALAKG